MRLTLRSGNRGLDLRIDGNDQAALEAAERTAIRLLQALGTSSAEPGTAVPPFGFASGSTTERTAPDPAPENEDAP
ncbi:hypothetical protein [Streptomyces sp. NPDC001404]|uniref:hypothetical protein n=1 Tax=Streptomyces sp. NPDC001404 TaxID=3364571 RepID=UPI0036C934AE